LCFDVGLVLFPESAKAFIEASGDFITSSIDLNPSESHRAIIHLYCFLLASESFASLKYSITIRGMRNTLNFMPQKI
jgi:hypothetical protein